MNVWRYVKMYSSLLMKWERLMWLLYLTLLVGKHRIGWQGTKCFCTVMTVFYLVYSSNIFFTCHDML